MFGFGKKKEIEEVDVQQRIKELCDAHEDKNAILRIELSSKTRIVAYVTRIGKGWIDVTDDHGEETFINTTQIIQVKDVTESEGHPHPMREKKDNAEKG
jgi:hypothetical protein